VSNKVETDERVCTVSRDQRSRAARRPGPRSPAHRCLDAADRVQSETSLQTDLYYEAGERGGEGGGIPSGWVWHSGGSYLHKWTIKTVNVSKCNLLDPYRYFQFHILFAPHNRTFSKTPIVHPLPLNDVCKLLQLFMFFKLNSMSIFVFCFV